MKIILVDDEEIAVQYMERLIRNVAPDAEFIGFIDPDDAFKYLSNNKVDVALLDIELGQYNGIDWAKNCKELCPQINIIFITGYSQYVMDAFQLRVSGYLMKPVRASDLLLELENLRNPIWTESYKRVRVQTFGNFEIFVEEQPLKLPLLKCRECLAYLIDRKGALVTVAELAAVLWEDKPFDRALRNSVHQVISKMMKALKAVNAEEIIIKYSREIGIDTSKIDCDYYRVLAGEKEPMNLFTGEYMNNYSWAEVTLGSLVTIKN